MNFLIDIGNTSCKTVEVYEDGLLTNLNRYKKPEEILGSIPSGIDKIVVSNVRDDDPHFYEVLAQNCNKLIVISVDYINDLIKRHPENSCLKIVSNMPEGMGADRICAILSAHYHFVDEDLMVFDFGTATTIEFIDKAANGKDAQYLGGVISLGLKTRYRAISHFTKKVPLCDPTPFIDKPISCIGTDLDTALAAGNILGIKFEIEGYIAENKHRTVIFSGGYAAYFINRIKGPIYYVKNLVIEGMALIAKYDE